LVLSGTCDKACPFERSPVENSVRFQPNSMV
jgi:hypothetical protein